MARFKIVLSFLSVVDYSNIYICEVFNLEVPEVLEDVQVAWDIETIFNQGEVLFIDGRQGVYLI